MTAGTNEDNEVFATTIERISHSGNGIVEQNGKTINIGPIKRDAVGDKVRIRQKDKRFGICLTESATVNNYDEKIESLLFSDDKIPDFCDSCGSVMKMKDQKWVCSFCHQSKPAGNTSHKTKDQSNLNSNNSENDESKVDETNICPDISETFETELSRINSSGNGLVEVKSGVINVGPVDKKELDGKIKIKRITKTYGLCLENEVRSESYQNFVNSLAKSSISIDSNLNQVEQVSNEETTEDSTANDRKNEDPNPDISNKQNLERIEPGDVFTTKVDRISGGGNAITSAGQLNQPILGKIDASAGDIVQAVYIGGEYAVSLDHVEEDTYTSSLPLPSNKVPVNKPDVNGSLSEGDVLTVQFYTHTNLGHAVGKKDGCMIHLPVSQSHKFTSDSPKHEVKIKFKIGKFAIANLTNDDKTHNKSDTENEEIEVEDRTEKQNVSKNDNYENETKSNTGNVETNLDDPSKLKEKRRRAEEAASESPENNITQSSGTRYSRSPAIKDYAKSRANGVCEYCGEQAPFRTEDNEPYLEAHHVDELGEGGNDHPDKVVALCPDCHKEIHYGIKGDEINQTLREKLEDGLAEVGD